MDVQIEGQHTAVEAGVQEWITRRLEAFNTPHDDIIHARVTLLKHERHQKGSEEARLLLTLSGKTLSVARTADTVDDALYQAFDVMTRELRDFRSIRQRGAKMPGPSHALVALSSPRLERVQYAAQLLPGSLPILDRLDVLCTGSAKLSCQGAMALSAYVNHILAPSDASDDCGTSGRDTVCAGVVSETPAATMARILPDDRYDAHTMIKPGGTRYVSRQNLCAYRHYCTPGRAGGCGRSAHAAV